MSKSTNSKDSEFLFSEFPQYSAKEWKQFIQAELKGADYNQSLVWESLEGIKVKPFYHADETEYLNVPMPKSEFKISQSFFIDDESIANKIALESIQKGTECVIFIAEKGFDVDVLLQNFEKSKVQLVVFKLHYLAPHFIKQVKESFPKLPLEFQIDPIYSLVKTGNWFVNEKQDTEQIGEILEKLSGENILLVNTEIYQNAGANMVQQVAYALAHANEYLNVFGKKITGKIAFEFAIGSNFFFEIAKLRAFRYLWQQLTSEYGFKIQPQIFCHPTSRNKTLYDYNVNILRTSTEGMSAVLGGANVVNSQSYDSFFKKSNEFGERIARNQLILLKAENEFNEAQNYATGSYYIESLAIEIAKKALDLLKEIEKSGGFISQLKAGTIQKKIKEASNKEQDLFDKGELVLLGTNKYTNPKDKMKNEIDIFPFVKHRSVKTEISPIVPVRLAEKLEQNRLEQES